MVVVVDEEEGFVVVEGALPFGSSLRLRFLPLGWESPLSSPSGLRPSVFHRMRRAKALGVSSVGSDLDFFFALDFEDDDFLVGSLS